MAEVGGAAVCDLVKTGDLVLFGGDGPMSVVLGWLGRRRLTHVGLVLRVEPAAEPMLFEANAPGRRARGARVMRLVERLADCGAPVSLRCLSRALDEVQAARLNLLRHELAEPAGKPRLLDLMSAADDGWLGASPERLVTPLAAELVAAAYQQIGLLDDVHHGGRACADYAPRDFAEAGMLKLKGGFALGPEIAIEGVDRTSGWTGLTPQPA